jgi:Sulfotransferase family
MSVRTTSRVPDFFVIGHQKCGTTALYYMLRDHPEVFLSEYKEPRYFSPELRPAGRESPDRPQTLERYLELFARASDGQLIGDTSPQYIRSPTAAERIASLQPSALIIAILREPADYLRSYHMQMVISNVEPEKDLAKAIALERRRREAGSDGSFVPPQHLYSEHVRYVEQLRRFEAEFGRDRMLLIVYDDFRRDNETTMRRVQRFLEIDDTLPLTTLQTKPLNAVRSVRAHRLKEALGRIKPAWLPSGPLAGAARRLAYAAPRDPDADLVLELRRRFKPEVVALGEYLDRDLVSLWGYGDVD